VTEGSGSDPVNGAEHTTPGIALPPNPANPVFISYASQDAALSEALCAALEREGVACWIAPRNVRPGDFYADAIVNAINASPLLVLVLSKNSADSAHVLREVERASAKRRPIIAFRIDTAPLPPGLEYFLSASQWIDAGSGTPERGFRKLVEALRGRVSSTPEAESGRPTVRPPAKRSQNRIVIVVAAVVVAALVYFIADRFWLSKHVTAESPTAAAANVVSDKSIAVLPFADMSEKKDQEYFADGMAEEIIDLLAKIPGLTVIGRTSSFQFKGKSEDLRTIGTLLNAVHVLEGSVRNAGDQVRITAQLINTRTGTKEWSETYDRHIGDVLKLQEAIAAAVVRELQLTVNSGGLNLRSTLKSAEAYDLMLRGRHAADRWDEEGLDEAVTLFKQALDRDPTSADAAAELAFAYFSQGVEVYVTPAAAFEQARQAAAAALKLDPQCVLAHHVLGVVHLNYDWDWSAAEQEFQQEAMLAPGSAGALVGEGNLSLAFGRWDDALRQMKAALAQDPLDVTSLYDLAEVQMRRGHLPEAEAAMRRGLDIRPTYDWGHWLLGLVLLARGDRDAALLEIQRVTSDDGRQTGLAIIYHALGRKADSDAALARLINERANTSAFEIANVYAYRGQPDEALHWLERAYAQKDPGLVYVKAEQPLKSLEGDARYKAFLRKMNLPE
jgi:TolB-like protein/Flp pilus assembly protein TadD